MDVIIAQMDGNMPYRQPSIPGVFYRIDAALYRYEEENLDLVRRIRMFPEFVYFPKEINCIQFEKTLKMVFSKNMLREVDMVDSSLSEVPIMVRVTSIFHFFSKHYHVTRIGGFLHLGVVLNARI